MIAVTQPGPNASLTSDALRTKCRRDATSAKSMTVRMIASS